MFTITIEEEQARIPVTIAHLVGELDASSYQALIDKTVELYEDGTRDLLLDLSQLVFMSSTGLVALHTMALVLRGEKISESESGWNTFQSITRDLQTGTDPETHLKLLNPQSRVKKTLDISGFAKILTIYETREEALASF